MKLLNTLVLSIVACTLVSCANDGPKMAAMPQKLIQVVNDKYPAERTNLIFVSAPGGVFAPKLSVNEVNDGVEQGKVLAIITSLKIKTSTVIIAGEDEDLTSATLEKALVTGKDQISGSKIVYFGGKSSSKHLSESASNAGVNIEFMDLPG